MYDLDLFKEDTSLSNPDEMTSEQFDEEAERIQRSLICKSNAIDEESRQEHRRAILEDYWSEFKICDGPPELNEILIRVIERNWETALELGALDFYHGQGQTGYRAYLKYEEDKEDSDYISDLAEWWDKDFMEVETITLGDYIAEILLEFGLSFSYGDADEISLVNRKCDVYVGDCQNILFTEWHIVLHAPKDRRISENDLKRIARMNIVG